MALSIRQISISLALLCSLTGCASQQMGSRSSVVDYLYPTESEVMISPATPVLQLPIRLGIAFVPADRSHQRGDNPWAWQNTGANLLTEPAKMQILDNIAAQFREREFIGDIQVIPSAYLRPQGSFTNLDQLKTMFGVDVIALVSFDQAQFSDDSKAALSYWTLVGAYLVSGQKNDTSTLMDTAVYAIDSRKLLFRAPGVSQIQGRSTPINLSEELRLDSSAGFAAASEDMISNLETELQRFTERLKARPEDIQIVKSSNYRGGGSFGSSFLIIIFGLWLSRQRARQPLSQS
ncbi:rhombotarget lipoprotein [Rheinheimera sp. UJ63]|uniref:rhombotarget lipoprotein n=1 Tax=Rheinheimera sp. UJ63 TaxID=2910157 RepID=UPI001F1CA343|nr:rhombotarget lipoprotein [Rheinheimera sp. UJ63]MCF4009321.1 rhombotarget lipoprotein [Rheinheimera sp. UJ63]